MHKLSKIKILYNKMITYDYHLGSRQKRDKHK